MDTKKTTRKIQVFVDSSILATDITENGNGIPSKISVTSCVNLHMVAFYNLFNL